MARKKKNKQDDTIAEQPKSALRENIEAIVIALILALFIRTFFVQAFKIPTGSMLETLQIGDHILVNKFIYGVKIPFAQKTIIPVKQPKKDDIVVFIYPVDKRDFIKRVVAVGGDTIEIKNKKVFINNKFVGNKPFKKAGTQTIPDCGIKGKDFQKVWQRQLDLQLARYKTNGNYTSPPLCLRDNFGPIKVPEGSLFVMGDNRDSSHDSRFWGFVPLSAVKGKAMIIYWSWDSTVKKSMGDRLMFWKWVRWNRIFDLLK